MKKKILYDIRTVVSTYSIVFKSSVIARLLYRYILNQIKFFTLSKFDKINFKALEQVKLDVEFFSPNFYLSQLTTYIQNNIRFEIAKCDCNTSMLYIMRIRRMMR